MALSEADERRVEGEVAGMAAELRERPSQEKEDRIGVEISLMPEEERAFVPIALLRMVAAERDGGVAREPTSRTNPAPPSRRVWRLFR